MLKIFLFFTFFNLYSQQVDYEKILIENPDDKNALYNFATVLYKKNDYENANKYYQRLLNISPLDKNIEEQARFNYANSLMKLEKFQEALDEYEKILKKDPSNKKAKHNRDVAKNY